MFLFYFILVFITRCFIHELPKGEIVRNIECWLIHWVMDKTETSIFKVLYRWTAQIEDRRNIENCVKDRKLSGRSSKPTFS